MLLRDLLSKDGEKLDIKINPDGTGQLHVPGLRVIEVKSFQHIKKVTHCVLNETFLTVMMASTQKCVFLCLSPLKCLTLYILTLNCAKFVT